MNTKGAAIGASNSPSKKNNAASITGLFVI